MQTLKGMSEGLWNQILLWIYGADQYIVTQDFPLSFIAHLPEEKKIRMECVSQNNSK